MGGAYALVKGLWFWMQDLSRGAEIPMSLPMGVNGSDTIYWEFLHFDFLFPLFDVDNHDVMICCTGGVAGS